MFGAIVCTISGTLVFLVGVRQVRLVRRLRQYGIRTSGLVIGQTREHTDSGHYFKPVISFTDRHGHTLQFQPGVGGSGYGLATGREVPVVYLPDDAEKARVDMPRFMARPAWFLVFFGLLFLGIAVVIFTKTG